MERDQRLSSHTFLYTTHIPNVVAIIVINVSFENHMKWSEKEQKRLQTYIYLSNMWIVRNCNASPKPVLMVSGVRRKLEQKKTDENIFHRIFSMNKIAIFHILESHSWALANGMLSPVWWMVGSRWGVRRRWRQTMQTHWRGALHNHSEAVILCGRTKYE